MAYVDAQRNVAVSYGERDVKADVTAKNKRERTVASNVEEGDTADAFLAQVENIKSNSFRQSVDLRLYSCRGRLS